MTKRTCPVTPACGYRHKKPNTPCDLSLPGKVTKNRTGDTRTVKEIRREIKAVFTVEPRPFIRRPRGTTLVKVVKPNPAHATDLLAPEEITVFEAMKDRPTGQRYHTFATSLGARNLARMAA